MKRYLWCTALFFCFTFFFSQEKSKVIERINGVEYYIHQVKKGESLYGISKLYGVNSEIILNENPIIKEKGLKAGYKILIPIKKEQSNITPVVDTIHFKYHKVLRGQTVYSICKQYNITQDEFYEFNPDKKSGLKENDMVIVGKKSSDTKKSEIEIQQMTIGVMKKDSVVQQKFERKDKYNVLLLLPFNANKAGEIIPEDLIKTQQDFPLMSSMMIDFYMGIKYSADSLKSDNFDIRIVPLDVNESDSSKMTLIVNTPEYKNSDIIIGPVFSSLIKTEQLLSKDRKPHIIPFVSQNKFLFNHPEYSKTTPSLYTDIQALAHYIFDSLRKKSKVVLIHSNVNGEKEYAKEFKHYYNDLVYKNNLKDTVHSFRNIYDFKQTVKDNMSYCVVLLTNNQIIATDYITQLSIINKTSPIQLCGFYKTIMFDNLDLEYLNQMNYTFAYYQNISYKHIYTTYLKKYKEEFYSDPSIFLNEGMQIGLYYFNLLKTQGLQALYDLNNNSYLWSHGGMRFQFYRPDESTGFQNNGEFIFKITDRKITLVR